MKKKKRRSFRHIEFYIVQTQFSAPFSAVHLFSLVAENFTNRVALTNRLYFGECVEASPSILCILNHKRYGYLYQIFTPF